MNRASLLILGVMVVAVILGIGYFGTYQPQIELRTDCATHFSRMDASNDDMKLGLGEFLTYGPGVSPEEFAEADRDRDQSLSLQEFCSWEGARQGTG